MKKIESSSKKIESLNRQVENIKMNPVEILDIKSTVKKINPKRLHSFNSIYVTFLIKIIEMKNQFNGWQSLRGEK